MAIPKKVKQGGCYYKGSTLAVASAAGDYVLFLSISGTGGCALNGLSIIPASAGPLDTMKLQHVANSTGGAVLATLAESIPNLGAGIPINLDFYAQELMLSGEALKLTYTNTASVAMSVFVILERGR